MVAEAIQSPAESPPPVEAPLPSTPASEAPAQPPPIQEAPTGEQEAETPGISEAPKPRAVSELNAQEQEAELKTLRDKALKEGTSSVENERIERLNQAVTTRQREYSNWLTGLESQQQEQLNTLVNTSNQEWAQVEAALQLGRLDDPMVKELYDQRIGKWAEGYQRIVQEASLRELRRYALETLGDSPENRRHLFSSTDPVQLAKDIAMAAVEMGRQRGPGPDRRVTLVSEWKDGVHQPSAKKAVDDYKAANPGAVSPAAFGSRSAGGGAMTYARYMGATPEDRAAFETEQPEAYQAMLRAESRRRGGGR